MSRSRGNSLGNIGLFGGTGAFANIQCSQNDDSFYCQFAKIYSEISMGFSLIFMIGFIIYFAYLGKEMLKKR